jgi:dipeptidyl aminopeptidase/acylaminoacyl peptidase
MNHKRIIFAYIILLIISLSFSATYSQQELLTPKILVSLETVTETAIDPEGRYIAFARRVQRAPGDERGGAYSELFVIPSAGGEPVQFTHRPSSVSNIQWSPDGSYIYFRSNRSAFFAGMQVYRLARTGGEAELITKAPVSVQAFKLSPDGEHIAYILTDEKPADIKKQEEDWIIEAQHYLQRRLFVQKPGSEETTLITDFNMSVWDFEWAPDSRRILIQASPLPTVDHSYMYKKMFVVEAGKTTEPRLLTDTEGKLGGMAWSPDGRHVAWHGGVDMYDPTEGTMFVAETATGNKWELIPGFEGTATWISWIDNTTVAFISEEEVWTRMSTIPYRGGNRTVLFGENHPNFKSVHFPRDRRTFVTAGSAYNHPGEVFIGNIRQRELRRRTHHNPVLNNMQFNNYEFVEYPASDGLRITGLLLKPLDYREGNRYPLICQIHGGPEAAYTHGWNTGYSAMTQLYSHLGYMVFLPNYRASTGRGVEYSKADHRDLGGKEFTDVIDGVEYLNGKGLIDRGRVGITGGSYGGYFSALAATRYAGNFAASAMFVGISNWFSDSGTSDIPYENSLVHFNAWHFKEADRVLFMESSPIWYLERAVQPGNETPLLILHGAGDERVPVGQADELWIGLRMAYDVLRGYEEKDIPLTYIRFPRGGHGLFEVKQQLRYSETILEFFEKHLK